MREEPNASLTKELLVSSDNRKNLVESKPDNSIIPLDSVDIGLESDKRALSQGTVGAHGLRLEHKLVSTQRPGYETTTPQVAVSQDSDPQFTTRKGHVRKNRGTKASPVTSPLSEVSHSKQKRKLKTLPIRSFTKNTPITKLKSSLSSIKGGILPVTKNGGLEIMGDQFTRESGRAIGFNGSPRALIAANERRGVLQSHSEGNQGKNAEPGGFQTSC